MVLSHDRRLQRVGIALFADYRLLLRAIRELRADQAQPEPVPKVRVCIMGTASGLAALRAHAPEEIAVDVQRALHQAQPVAALADGQPLLAAMDHLEHLDVELERRAYGVLHGLDPLLIEGNIALLVASQCLSTFIAITRILLRYSSHSVRTREILLD